MTNVQSGAKWQLKMNSKDILPVGQSWHQNEAK
jgi:hypothetical protein